MASLGLVTMVLGQILGTSLGLPVAVPAPFPAGVGPDGTRYKTAYKCEGERLDISCSEDARIRIIRANFGRFSIAICNRHGIMDMSVNCMAPSSTRVMKKKCDNRGECSIQISSGAFGDPCPNTPKYLEVHYGCVPTTTTTTKRPLPPWFLEGGGDQLWDSRIPDPPEGFETADQKPAASVASDSNDQEDKDEDVLDRIPITTPSATAVSSTVTPSTTVSTSPATTAQHEEPTTSAEMLKEGKNAAAADDDDEDMLEYFPLTPASSDNHNDGRSDDSVVSVRIVDIPPAGERLFDHCPPAGTRGGLAWNWTAAGAAAVQPCPSGTTGLARWSCSSGEGTDHISHGGSAGGASTIWQTPTPDLGDCKTTAMSRLEGRVQAGDLENVISAALAHLTRTEAGGLYGGDVEAATAIMRTLANRIQYLLQTQGDTFYNKRTYIQEVLLNMVRAASNLLDAQNRAAWRDLSVGRQIKAANSLLSALEENALLLAEVTASEEILVETAKNIYMTVSVQEIGRLNNGTRLPLSNYDSEEEEANNHVSTLYLPFALLWEQAMAGIVKLVHFSFTEGSLHEILGQAEVVLDESTPAERFMLNSRIISASFGRARKAAAVMMHFPETVEVVHAHIDQLPADAARACVLWNGELTSWSESGCSLVDTNATHTVCRCTRLGPYSLAVRGDTRGMGGVQAAAGGNSGSISVVSLQIVTYVVAAISVLCVVLILLKFRRSLMRLMSKLTGSQEKHVCNPRAISVPMPVQTDKLSHHTMHSNMQQRAFPTANIGGGVGPEFLIQSQDGTVTLLTGSSGGSGGGNAGGQPVMVTLNPYSSQLVDSLNRMMQSHTTETGMADQSEYGTTHSAATLNPQLARLTATLRKKRCCELGPCRHRQVNIHENTLQLADSAGGGSLLLENGRLPPPQVAVSPAEVVFRAVSPHGHVYWEINPSARGEHNKMTSSLQQPATAAMNNKSQHSTTSSDENTNSDLQNLSDFSDDDHAGVVGAMMAATTRAHSEMSRQSSSRFSESRPLIYSSSSASTSPGNSASSAAEFAAVRGSGGIIGHPHHHLQGGHISDAGGKLPPRFSRGMGRPWTTTPNYHEEVYAYAATDFSAGSASGVGNSGIIPEQLQSQVQIRDCRAVPVSVKSKEYIMAKIADYTERHMNQV